MSELSVLASGLGFPEGLRWHAGELWYSDFRVRRVFSMTPEGVLTERAYLPGQPSGLGFLPDGTPVVASMIDRKVLKLGGEGLNLHADCASVCIGPMNDLIVSPDGTTYFGSFGFDPTYEATDALRPSFISSISIDGQVKKVADGLSFPNGMAVSPDGQSLVVAETFANQLTKFPILPDGGLGEGEIFAQLGDYSPDGISMDADGAVWVGCPFNGAFLRVAEGGEILQKIETPGRWAVACALGGDDGHTLFCATAETTVEDFHQGRSTGAIEAIRVSVGAPGSA